jgi:hypothetical protein
VTYLGTPVSLRCGSFEQFPHFGRFTHENRSISHLHQAAVPPLGGVPTVVFVIERQGHALQPATGCVARGQCRHTRSARGEQFHIGQAVHEQLIEGVTQAGKLNSLPTADDEW